MKSNFIERLIAGTMGEESSIAIRPAITPDVLPESFHLPETFYLPEQQFMQAPLESQVISGPESQTKDFIEPAKIEAPLPDKIAEEIKATTPQKRIHPADDAHVRDVETKDIERKEPSKDRSKESMKTVATEKIEKEDVARVPPKTKDIEIKESKPAEPVKKEPMPTPAVQKDIRIKVEEQEHPTEGKPQEVHIFYREHISSEPEKSYEEKRVVAEKGSLQIPTPPKHPQSPATGTVIPAKPVETKTELSPILPKTYAPISSKSPERSQDYSEPTVTINIGRIDVRAIMPQKPSTKTRTPALSLKDYLKQREGR